MAKFCNPKYAGEPVVFAYVGEVQLDSEGYFEIENQQLIDELKQLSEFRLIPETPKKTPKVEKKDTAVEKPTEKPSKVESNEDAPAGTTNPPTK